MNEKEKNKINVLGIIAEYNPFHNGHKFHLEESKRQSNADYVVAVMSGNFTQRGETSVIDKFEKAKIAVMNGVDIVIEIPTIYSTSSAENFAEGAIKILNELNIVSHISFGMETETINDLENIADILLNESQNFSKLLKDELKNGNSFPIARKNALIKYTGKENYGEIISEPNNILAIEYLKAMKKFNSKIKPIGIKRQNVNHKSNNIINNFASSTEIRKLICEKNGIENLKNCIPNISYEILKKDIENGDYVSNLNSFEDIIIYKLREMELSKIQEIPDVTEGIENLLKSSAKNTNNLEELIEKCKSKRYTQTRLQRIFTYILLNITKKDMEMSRNIIPYARILGINDKGLELLHIINNYNKHNTNNSKENIENKTLFKDEFSKETNELIDNKSRAKLIMSIKKFEKENKDQNLQRMLEIDKFATDIYSIKQKNRKISGKDYTIQPFYNIPLL